MDLGVLLTLPLESIAIRAVLAAAACVLLVRLMLRTGLRAPGVRVASAIAPTITLVAVAVLTWGSLNLPSLMLPVQPSLVLPVHGVEALPIWVGDGYLHFAPIAAPLLAGVWGMIAGVRLARRGLTAVRVRRRARSALRRGTVPPGLAATTTRLAAALRMPTPHVTVIESCPGGAVVIGSRRPVVILAEELCNRLDDDELEGVIAHELAHVKRRDNLVATVVGMVRDIAFFVPGGRWAVRQLHRERERAADQAAVRVTRRPGALASGLLKVLERGPGPAHPCAALAPNASVVDRVRELVVDQPPMGRVRRGTEIIAVTVVIAIAVVVALVLPTALTGTERQREAVAVGWSSTASAPAAEAEAIVVGEARAFDAYRRTDVEVDVPAVSRRALHDEHSAENRRATLHACADERAECPAPVTRVGLGLQPRPTITVDDALVSAWKANPVLPGVQAGDGFMVYWLARVE